jgi:hypothetical protein
MGEAAFGRGAVGGRKAVADRCVERIVTGEPFARASLAPEADDVVARRDFARRCGAFVRIGCLGQVIPPFRS